MGRRIKTTKNKKNVKRFSWHFWFLLGLTLVAMLMGFSSGMDNNKPIITSLSFGALVYLSPLFLSVIRNMMPRSLMLKFYKKSL